MATRELPLHTFYMHIYPSDSQVHATPACFAYMQYITAGKDNSK